MAMVMLGFARSEVRGEAEAQRPRKQKKCRTNPSGYGSGCEKIADNPPETDESVCPTFQNLWGSLFRLGSRLAGKYSTSRPEAD